MRRSLSYLLVLLMVASSSWAGDQPARDFIAGPVEAELVNVIDGDTIRANARPWPQQQISVLVRIRGIDAPEMRSRCSRLAALQARQALVELVTPRLMLSNISGDKYFGRIVADVGSDRSADLAGALVATGLVAHYDGGTKVRESC